MTEIPQRSSLVIQVADILRRGLKKGEWQDSLPGELPLCDRLQVSRPTLRAALDLLRREGLIQVSQGRRRGIIAKTNQISNRTKSKIVGFLSTEPLYDLSPYTMFRIGELRRHLQDVGYRLEVHADPRIKQRHPFRTLESLVHQTKANCWVLYRSTAEVQRWFFKRGLRVIVMGSCHEGIYFPSLDVHFKAVCRHAVGVFLSMGHRRIGLVLPKSGWVGDHASEEGFLEGFQAAHHPDARPLIVHHDRTVNGIRSVLANLFRSRNPPSGLLVSHPEHVLTVVSRLINSGIRLPRDVSLIARDDESFLAHVTPSIARYRFNRNVYAARLSRMVVQLARTGVLAPRQTRVMAQLQKGDTLAVRV